jgi:hypothetical protein
MTLLTRETLIKHSTFRRIEVDVTPWGEVDPDTGKPIPTSVFVRELSSRERDMFEESVHKGKGAKRELNFINARAKLVAVACCDADGNLIFQPEDVEWLTNKPVGFLNRIYNAAMKINGFTDEDEEELLGNLPTTTISCSGTTSPSPSVDIPSKNSKTK